MRSDKERVAAVRRRAAELKRQRRVRQGTLLTGCCGAASLALIVGLAGFMPDALRTAEDGYADFETAGSIFSTSPALGYIAIGLLAFALGVCVTILCFRIRALSGEDRPEEQDNDGTD